MMPPRWPLRWLERHLHPDERHEILGDLTEQFHGYAATHGPRAARRWYWRQAASLGWGFWMRRRDVVSATHERTRGQWLLWNAASDWRYALRALRHAPNSTAVALLTLTLSLGLSTTVFSLVNSLLLRPLPYPSANRLVRLSEVRPPRSGQPVESSGGQMSDVALGQFLDAATTLEAVTPYALSGRTVTTVQGAEQRSTAEVGVAFFDLLGIRPSLGRVFDQGDAQPDAPATVVISESLWRQALGGRDDILGGSLLVDDTAYTIVGVVSSDLRFPEGGIELWTAGRWSWPSPGRRRSFQMWIQAVGRLSADATLDSATAEARQIATGLATADPAFLDGADVPVPVFRVRQLQDDIVAPIRPALLALAVGMALVLLAACANMVNLLLARSTARHREMAVRLAMGASRWRVVRPLLFEQVILAGLGAAAGGLLAFWLLRTLPAFAPAALARLVDVEFDQWSLAFTSGIALTVALIVGWLPALQLPAGNLRQLSGGGQVMLGRRITSAEGLRRVLVGVQVALAVILLVGATLLGRTVQSLTAVNPGYLGEGALTFQVGLPDDIFRQPERQTAFFEDVLARLVQHPRIVATGASSTLPLNDVGFSGSFLIEGRPVPASGDRPRADKIAITPGYLAAVGTPVMRGRNFTESDTGASEPVVLIDESTAHLYFAGEEPIGQRIDYLRQNRRIVGVVAAIKQKDVTQVSQAALYFPAAQMPPVFAFNRLTGGVAVRVTGDPMDVVPFIRDTVREVDAASPIFGIARLDDRLGATFAGPRFYALALGLFALLAITTSILGVYGVLSYAVERRWTEFGIRRALGGGERHILALVMRQAIALLTVGLVVGLGASVIGTEVLRTLLFGVEPLDAATFVGAAAFVSAVGLCAAMVPAWRAVRVDPVRALRSE